MSAQLRLMKALLFLPLFAVGFSCRGPGLASAARPAAGGTPDSFELVIAATTDVHGRLRGWDYYRNAPDPLRSLAGAATIVDSLRQANAGRVLLVDGGDLLQGNPMTFVAARVTRQPVHPVIAAMNAMHYDAAVIGNHEFNYGVPLLDSAIAQSSFPFLAANVWKNGSTHKYPALTYVERNGAKIAIIGATTPGPMVWDRDNMAAAKLTVTDIVPAIRTAVGQAKNNGADIIVVLMHSGLDEVASYDTVTTGLPSENVAARVPREIEGIDAIVFGHSHRELIDTVINGALLMQPRNWAASVGVGTLRVSKVNGHWHVTDRTARAIPIAGHAESPAVLAATDAAHRAAVAWTTSPVARTTSNWRSDSARVVDVPIVDFMLEVMRREAKADLAATAAFSTDAAFQPGNITTAQLSRLYPYDNTLRSVRITGAQLRAFLDYSSRYCRTLLPDGSAPPGGMIDPNVPGYNFDIVAGADYTIDLTKPLGRRITELSVHGRPVADSDSFTMALNNYRQGGGGGFAMLAGAPVVYQKDVDIRQLLIDEATRVGTLEPSAYATKNWRIVPQRAIDLIMAGQTRNSGLNRDLDALSGTVR